jgi:hypothetical protein
MGWDGQCLKPNILRGAKFKNYAPSAGAQLRPLLVGNELAAFRRL